MLNGAAIEELNVVIFTLDFFFFPNSHLTRTNIYGIGIALNNNWSFCFMIVVCLDNSTRRFALAMIYGVIDKNVIYKIVFLLCDFFISLS